MDFCPTWWEERVNPPLLLPQEDSYGKGGQREMENRKSQEKRTKINSEQHLPKEEQAQQPRL